MGLTEEVFGKVTPYGKDISLLRELGLEEFEGELKEDIFVGEVKMEYRGRIKIWVVGMPAQFWQFEIVDPVDRSTYKVSTGEGSLKDFWPSVKMMSENMLMVESIFRAEEK